MDFVNESNDGVRIRESKRIREIISVTKRRKGAIVARGYSCENVAGEGEKEDFRCRPLSDSAFVNICRDILRKNGVETISVQVKLNKALPDTLDTFQRDVCESENG